MHGQSSFSRGELAVAATSNSQTKQADTTATSSALRSNKPRQYSSTSANVLYGAGKGTSSCRDRPRPKTSAFYSSLASWRGDGLRIAYLDHRRIWRRHEHCFAIVAKVCKVLDTVSKVIRTYQQIHLTLLKATWFFSENVIQFSLYGALATSKHLKCQNFHSPSCLRKSIA